MDTTDYLESLHGLAIQPSEPSFPHVISLGTALVHTQANRSDFADDLSLTDEANETSSVSNCVDCDADDIRLSDGDSDRPVWDCPTANYGDLGDIQPKAMDLSLPLPEEQPRQDVNEDLLLPLLPECEQPQKDANYAGTQDTADAATASPDPVPAPPSSDVVRAAGTSPPARGDPLGGPSKKKDKKKKKKKQHSDEHLDLDELLMDQAITRAAEERDTMLEDQAHDLAELALNLDKNPMSCPEGHAMQAEATSRDTADSCLRCRRHVLWPSVIA